MGLPCLRAKKTPRSGGAFPFPAVKAVSGAKYTGETAAKLLHKAATGGKKETVKKSLKDMEAEFSEQKPEPKTPQEIAAEAFAAVMVLLASADSNLCRLLTPIQAAIDHVADAE